MIIQGYADPTKILQDQQTVHDKIVACLQAGSIKYKQTGGRRVYAIEVGRTPRVLITFEHVEGIYIAVILAYLEHHEYDKSPFMVDDTAVNRFIEKYAQKIAQRLIRFEHDHATAVIDKAKHKILLVGRSGDKSIVLSAAQSSVVLTKERPLFIEGSPGTGKTTVLFNVVRDLDQIPGDAQIYYFATTDKLVDQFSKDCRQLKNRQVICMTYDALFKHKISVDNRNIVGRQHYETWYKAQRKRRKLSWSFDTIFNETRNIAALDGDFESQLKCYRTFGIRQSRVDKEHREEVFELYQQYLKTLEEASMVSSAISRLNIEVTEPDCYCLLDEAQDCHPLALIHIADYFGPKALMVASDMNQSTISSQSSVLQLQAHLSDTSPTTVVLTDGFRNSVLVSRMVHAMIRLKLYIAGGRLSTEAMSYQAATSQDTMGRVEFIDKINQSQYLEKLQDACRSPKTCVLIPNKDLYDTAKALFNTVLIFEVNTVAGLEWDTIIYYDPFNSTLFRDISKDTHFKDLTESKDYNRPKDKVAWITTEPKILALNEAIIGVSRACKDLYIINLSHNPHHMLPLIAYFKSVIYPGQKSDVSMKQEAVQAEEITTVSDLELEQLWHEEAKRLEAYGLKEVAQDIRKTYNRNKVASKVQAQPIQATKSKSPKVTVNDKPEIQLTAYQNTLMNIYFECSGEPDAKNREAIYMRYYKFYTELILNPTAQNFKTCLEYVIKKNRVILFLFFFKPLESEQCSLFDIILNKEDWLSIFLKYLENNTVKQKSGTLLNDVMIRFFMTILHYTACSEGFSAAAPGFGEQTYPLLAKFYCDLMLSTKRQQFSLFHQCVNGFQSVNEDYLLDCVAARLFPCVHEIKKSSIHLLLKSHEGIAFLKQYYASHLEKYFLREVKIYEHILYKDVLVALLNHYDKIDKDFFNKLSSRIDHSQDRVVSCPNDINISTVIHIFSAKVDNITVLEKFIIDEQLHQFFIQWVDKHLRFHLLGLKQYDSRSLVELLLKINKSKNLRKGVVNKAEEMLHALFKFFPALNGNEKNLKKLLTFENESLSYKSLLDERLCEDIGEDCNVLKLGYLDYFADNELRFLIDYAKSLRNDWVLYVIPDRFATPDQLHLLMTIIPHTKEINVDFSLEDVNAFPKAFFENIYNINPFDNHMPDHIEIDGMVDQGYFDLILNKIPIMPYFTKLILNNITHPSVIPSNVTPAINIPRIAALFKEFFLHNNTLTAFGCEADWVGTDCVSAVLEGIAESECSLVSDISFEYFSEEENIPDMFRFNLSIILEKLKLCISLTHVALIGCHIDHNDLINLCDFLQENKNLEQLTLGTIDKCVFSQGFTRIIDSLTANKTLKKLVLVGADMLNAACIDYLKLQLKDVHLHSLCFPEAAADKAALKELNEEITQCGYNFSLHTQEFETCKKDVLKSISNLFVLQKDVMLPVTDAHDAIPKPML